MKIFPKLTVVILAVTLLVLAPIGCGPKAGSEDGESAAATSSPDGYVTLPPLDDPDQLNTPKPAPAGPAVVISGALEDVDWDSLVGKRVTIEGQLEIVDTYNLVRYGEVKVARERLFVPTSRIDPNDADASGVSFEGGSNVAKVVAAQKRNDKAILTLDDGAGGENIFPPKLFPKLGGELPTVRIGSVITELSGRIDKKRNTILLVPDGPLKWTPAERPSRPGVGDADVTVASFNVLNYFTTIDNGSNNARGADSDSEFTRQDAKIVAAIGALEADVVGLMEIENSPGAEERLVANLNKAAGSDVFKGCGIPDGFRNVPGGSDAIRVALIYRSDRVSPVGEVTMIKNGVFGPARAPVVQTFKSNDGGKPFTVIVNHFKSKGGASDADAANKNKGDGQGAYNAARRSQALAIATYVDGLGEGDAKPRVLVLGDLNAYQQEDPIDALRAKGFVDLHSAEDYSYVYYGQCGSLDHALATENLAKDVTGIATWHINADEPRFLDYNQEYNPKSLFKADPFRSSDHDPVLIGIRK